jgi:hypothetical protein
MTSLFAAFEPISLRLSLDMPPFLASLGALVASALLLDRWARLDGGALAGTGWLGEVLAPVHDAARRRLFAEAASATFLTVLCLVGLVAALSLLGLKQGPTQPQALLPLKWEGWGWFGAPVALWLWLLWTYAVALGNERHHWFSTLAALHRPKGALVSQPQGRRTLAALAYCSNAALLDQALPQAQTTLERLWQEYLLLSINRQEREAHSFQHQGEVNALEKACRERGARLLLHARVRRAFGGGPVFFALALLLLLVASLTAVAGCHLVCSQIFPERPSGQRPL